jgi:hypothetical protein
MTFLFEGGLHHKNKIGLNLMITEGMQVDFNLKPQKNYDWIINSSQLLEYPNHEGGIIYGPQIMFYTENLSNFFQKDDNKYCNLLSEWNSLLLNEIFPEVKTIELPFPVDVDRFVPKSKTGRPIIYFKRRNPIILNDVLNSLSFDFLIFDYVKGYNEVDYLESISKAPFVIWIGSHESQGFALQESLSCDCPIFVINVRSLREETPSSLWHTYLPENSLKATSVPYFNEQCGLIAYPESWKEHFDLFLSSNFTPRDFVIKNLSPQACLTNWIKKLSTL